MKASAPALATLLATWSLATASHATELKWTAPAPCPAQSTVEELLSERVGQDYRSVGDFHFQARVVRVGAERWQLELWFEQPSAPAERDERRIEGATCSSVVEAGVVVMALALEQEKGAADPASPAVAAPSAASEAKPHVPAPTEPDRPSPPAPPSADRKQTVELGVAALALVDSGALPELAFGAEFGGELRISRLIARAAAFGFPRVRHDLEQGRGGEFQLFGGALAGCYLVRELPLAALGCAGFEMGALLGEGYGMEVPKQETLLWLGPTFDVGASALLTSGVALTLRLGLVVPLHRKSFVLDADETVHEPDVVTLRGGVGLSFFTE